VASRGEVVTGVLVRPPAPEDAAALPEDAAALAAVAALDRMLSAEASTELEMLARACAQYCVPNEITAAASAGLLQASLAQSRTP